MSSGCHGERLKFSTHRDELKSLEGLCWQPKCWREPLFPPLAKAGGLPHNAHMHSRTHAFTHTRTHARMHAHLLLLLLKGRSKWWLPSNKGAAHQSATAALSTCLPSLQCCVSGSTEPSAVCMCVCVHVCEGPGGVSAACILACSSIGELGLETVLASHCGSGLQCPFRGLLAQSNLFWAQPRKRSSQSWVLREICCFSFHPTLSFQNLGSAAHRVLLPVLLFPACMHQAPGPAGLRRMYWGAPQRVQCFSCKRLHRAPSQILSCLTHLSQSCNFTWAVCLSIIEV